MKRALVTIVMALLVTLVAAACERNETDTGEQALGGPTGTTALEDNLDEDVILESSLEADTVTITLDNIDSTAWVVTDIDGADDLAESGENPTLTLSVGTRYRFENQGGEAHPLDFRSQDNTFLLAQGSIAGSFENDAEVDFVEDEDGMAFTLTQGLADQIATYYCTVHPPMEGDIVIAQQ